MKLRLRFSRLYRLPLLSGLIVLLASGLILSLTAARGWSGNWSSGELNTLQTGLSAHLAAKFDGQFVHSYSKNSGHASYHYFKQLHKGVEVRHTGYVVVCDKSGIRSIRGHHLNAEQLARFELPQDLYRISPAELPEMYQGLLVETNAPLIHPLHGPCWSYRLFSSMEQKRLEVLLGSAGELLSERDLRCFFDSAAIALVFMPDPLTTAMVDYGGAYIDDGDADVGAINGERFNVQIVADFENDSFYLRNNFFEITELGDPVVPVLPEPVPTFLYERSEDGFEQVNAYYHLNIFKNHLDSLGFDSLANEPLQIDVHAVFGADNSFFLPGDSLTPSSLQFGEGGVDDAEDADVIIHEYAHAISYSAAPGSNVGFERQALDEGFGDYLAVSYSRSFSNHNAARVFSWDGHNPFWNGRRVDWPWHYPEDLGSSIYTAGQLWASAMFDIWDVYGRSITDALVIEAMHANFPNMNLRDAAQAILLADSLLFNGDHYDVLFDLLENRGLIEGNISGIGDQPVGAEGALLNSWNFANYGEALIYESQHYVAHRFSFIDLNGSEVWVTELPPASSWTLQPLLPVAGTYLLVVEADNGTSPQVFKVLSR